MKNILLVMVLFVSGCAINVEKGDGKVRVALGNTTLYSQHRTD